MNNEKQISTIGNTIEIRYCFNDENLHSMNAEIFNECEKQFIKALKSTEKYFEDTLTINIKPRKEGSLIDVFTVAINNPAITTTFTVLLTAFATKFFDAKLSSAIPKTDETSKKLDNIQKIKEEIKNGTLTETDFDYIASNDKDLKKQKSNFFKTAKKEQQIIKVESTTNIENTQPIIIFVERKDFDNFILPETTDTNETKDAKIYIAAPILIKVKGIGIFWKGIYENNPIDFRVSDKKFLEQVRSQTIQFRNGTYINCELKTTVKTNIETEETKISREVTNVSNCGDDENGFINIIHKKKSKNTTNIQQLSLFDSVE
jgi:hypothetical protein